MSCDSDAGFEEFFRAHIGPLTAFLVKAGFVAEAEDAGAEAMERLLRTWGGHENPRAWLWKAGYRIALRIARRRDQSVSRAVTGGWLDSGSDTRQWDLIEGRSVVVMMLNLLPERQRQVMAWHLDGFSHCEIADALGMAEPTVRSNLRHAKRRLRSMYQG